MGRGAPEPAWADILQPVDRLDSYGRPGERTPFDARAERPERGERLRRGVRGDPQRDTAEQVRAYGRATSESVELPPRAVEGPMAAETIMDQRLRREAMRKNAGPGHIGPELVAGRLIALIPAPVPHIDVAPLGGQRGDSSDEKEELNPRPQSRRAPRKREAPCDVRASAAAGA